MAAPLNFHHLYYFWVVAKEGGMARGAQRLGMAVQTVSAQVRALEQALGHALFKPAGRSLALTEAGEAALSHADQIFQLGEELPAAVRDAATGQAMRLRVGIPDGVPKLVVRHLLQQGLDDGAIGLSTGTFYPPAAAAPSAGAWAAALSACCRPRISSSFHPSSPSPCS